MYFSQIKIGNLKWIDEAVVSWWNVLSYKLKLITLGNKYLKVNRVSY